MKRLQEEWSKKNSPNSDQFSVALSDTTITTSNSVSIQLYSHFLVTQFLLKIHVFLQKNKYLTPLGYGYCQFEASDNAAVAQKELDGTMFNGKAIDVSKFLPKARRKTNKWKTNLYVKNFPEEWDMEKVDSFIDSKFSTFGKITSKSKPTPIVLQTYPNSGQIQ